MRGLNRELVGGVWLLWMGVGTSASLASAGFHWSISQSMGATFICLWMGLNVNLKTIFQSFFSTILEIFFKTFDVAGAARVPATGPVIFVCAPHANQFLDGLVAFKACGRKDLGFLTAGKTMRHKYIGLLARQMEAIPVERAQDMAFVAAGQVSIVGNQVIGHGSKFTAEIQPRSVVVLTSGRQLGARATVAEVVSDTELVLRGPLQLEGGGSTRGGAAEGAAEGPVGGSDGACGYKVLPHVDQSAMFEGVFKRLAAEGAVGIFPEGGSHDRTSLLPLKAGVAMMALGAMAKHDGLDVSIVPVGINYFNGHRFRSRVFVDIGEPFVPDAALVEQYRSGGASKREASGALLDQIQSALNTVTIQAASYDLLQFFRAMRRMYKGRHSNLNSHQQFQLMKAFSEGYDKVKDFPDVKALYEEISEYRALLRDHGIPDHKVACMERDQVKSGKQADESVPRTPASIAYFSRSWGLVGYRCGLLLFFALVALPGTIIAFPVTITARAISRQKAEKAVANSSVKLAGRDVLATWKVIVCLVMVPCMHVFYAALCGTLLGETPAVVYFFFAPIVAVGSIIATERTVKLAISIRAIVLRLTHRENGRISDLIQRRTRLQGLSRQVIQRHGWDKGLEETAASLYRRYSDDGQDSEEEDEQQEEA